jgi:hypothetical protein
MVIPAPTRPYLHLFCARAKVLLVLSTNQTKSLIPDATITIRRDRVDDHLGLVTLAQLDDSEIPHGPLLLAEVDGELLAAIAIRDGSHVADPFHHTAAIISLLRTRRRALAAPAARRWHRARALGARGRFSAHRI